MSDWISVKEMRPEVGITVLVNIDYDHHAIIPSILTGKWTGNTFKIGPNSVNFDCDAPVVTHWMPLPSPPQ